MKDADSINQVLYKNYQHDSGIIASSGEGEVSLPRYHTPSAKHLSRTKVIIRIGGPVATVSDKSYCIVVNIELDGEYL